MYRSTLFSLTSVAIAAWIASSPVTCVCCEGEDQGGRTTDASQTLDSCFSRRVSRETRRRGRANARRTGLKSSSESRANPRKPANERARTARQSSFRVRACVGSDAEGEGEARDDALAEALWEVSEALIDDALARREAKVLKERRSPRERGRMGTSVVTELVGGAIDRSIESSRLESTTATRWTRLRTRCSLSRARRAERRETATSPPRSS